MYVYRSYAIIIFLILCVLTACCPDSNKLDVYIWNIFKAGEKISLDIRNGDYHYQRTFSERFVREKHYLLTSYCMTGDSVKIQYKSNNRDTSFYVQKSVRRIVFGISMYGNPIIGTHDTDFAFD